MKKLTLSLDQLEVETFRVEDPQAAFGTVLGAESEPEEAIGITGWSWLCGSCDNTCGAQKTCPFSCAPPNATACNAPYCWNNPTTEPVTVAEA